MDFTKKEIILHLILQVFVAIAYPENETTVPPALFSHLYQEGAETSSKWGLGAQKYNLRYPGNIVVRHTED